MKYAVKTRDYKNDYRWSWEHNGRDFPLAEISEKLQRLIGDCKEGVAVLRHGGSFHVMFAAIKKLDTKSLGTDDSSTRIRLDLVFSDISQEKAKGLIRYYLTNRADPGVAFPDIVTWSEKPSFSWTINEANILEAFARISPVPTTGKKLLCQNGSGEPLDWLDYDFSEKDGAKFILQADQLKFAVDTVEIKGPPLPLPPKKCGGSFVIIGLILVILTFAIGFLGFDRGKLQTQINDLQARPTQEELKNVKTAQDNHIKELEEQTKTLESQINDLKDRPTRVELETVKTKYNDLLDYSQKQNTALEAEKSQLQEQLKADKDKFAEQLKTATAELVKVTAEWDKDKQILDGIDYKNPQQFSTPDWSKTFYWAKEKQK